MLRPLELYPQGYTSLGCTPALGCFFSQVKCGGTGWKALGLAQAGGGAAAAVPAQGSAFFRQDLRVLGQSQGTSG